MKGFKNITLVTLILISVLLFSRVWFGTNFIEEIKKNIELKKMMYNSDTAGFTVEEILTPENIIVTGGGKRNVISKSQSGYDELYKRMAAAIEKLNIQSDDFFKSEPDDWTSSLKTRSVLFDFADEYESELIKKLGINLPDGLYKNIIFVPSDSIAVNATVYIKNSNDDIYKFIAGNGKNELESIINKYAISSDAVNSPFAFELGFDKAKTNTGISQNVLLNSNIVIGLTEKHVGNAVLDISTREFNPKTVERLLEMFKFNLNTTRRYIDKDDVTVYVDNTATLKLYPSKFIEYTSESGGYSFSASDNNDKKNISEYVNDIYATVRAVQRSADINGMPILTASAINSENTKSEITIAFDYYVNGMPIYVNGENGAEHGVTAVLSDGNLKFYRHYLFNAEVNEDTENIGSMINALDTLYTKFKDEKEVFLSDMFVAYKAEKNSSLLTPVWCAKTEKEIIIINN